jgi:hypothetical protein
VRMYAEIPESVGLKEVRFVLRFAAIQNFGSDFQDRIDLVFVTNHDPHTGLIRKRLVGMLWLSDELTCCFDRGRVDPAPGESWFGRVPLWESTRKRQANAKIWSLRN